MLSGGPYLLHIHMTGGQDREWRAREGLTSLRGGRRWGREREGEGDMMAPDCGLASMSRPSRDFSMPTIVLEWP